ncbi:hypothetical protein DH2020_027729 [Rehmannia glutinosa]|uniref:RING-type E3 ubiquitin transferase n=1 Tax=Rehmannia glutinosa TaxID=99300 RepID=A0ABR0VW36_REHGL
MSSNLASSAGSMPRKNYYLLVLCFLSMMINIVDSRKDCLVSFCGENKSLPIRYPFQLDGKGQGHKGCPLNLKCSVHGNIPLLNLPSSGDFYVRSIDYSARTIRLYDPDGCLPGRLMNSNFSSFYHLMAVDSYKNYTFFSCRREVIIGMNFTTTINCLSNSTFSTLATSSLLGAEEMRSSGCNMVASVMIPVSSTLKDEYYINGFGEDLVFKWDVNVCGERICRSTGQRVKMLLIVVLGFPAVVTVVPLALLYALRYYEHLKTTRATRARTQEPTVSQPSRPPSRLPITIATVIPQATNNDCTAIVVGESRRIPGPNSTTCPICLDDYSPKETVKCIPKCRHCFHEKCIDQWLKNHTSCPICRNSA